MLLHYDSSILYSLSDYIKLYFMCLSLLFLILFILFYMRNSIMNLYKENHLGQLVDVRISTGCRASIGKKYISIQEIHYIVPLIRSSPIENKLHCVVLLRFANCISQALQKLIEIKCKLHDETHDTLCLIRPAHLKHATLHCAIKTLIVHFIDFTQCQNSTLCTILTQNYDND